MIEKLWLCVLQELFKEMLRYHNSCKKYRKRHRYTYQKTVDYVNLDNEDFILMCLYAGVDHEFIYEKFHSLNNHLISQYD